MREPNRIRRTIEIERRQMGEVYRQMRKDSPRLSALQAACLVAAMFGTTPLAVGMTVDGVLLDLAKESGPGTPAGST